MNAIQTGTRWCGVDTNRKQMLQKTKQNVQYQPASEACDPVLRVVFASGNRQGSGHQRTILTSLLETAAAPPGRWPTSLSRSPLLGAIPPKNFYAQAPIFKQFFSRRSESSVQVVYCLV